MLFLELRRNYLCLNKNLSSVLPRGICCKKKKKKSLILITEYVCIEMNNLNIFKEETFVLKL